MKTHHPLLVAAAVSLLMSACAVTHVAPPEPVAAPAAFKEECIWQHGASTQAAATSADWLTVFNDPVLNDLARRLVLGDESLKGLSAQLVSARAAVDAPAAAPCGQACLWGHR
ncbi:MAG: hypothetical protein EPO09_09435 [Aquabacterium sp.]|uniref:hypothetical protein n=1 Tax=Aquabacterium sp. TaxID=1872578 RepID=UPI0012172767|nr:hypothetical protein [Aquabacterium sp.]TAK94539.1 MAG: hypothetical protein EPO09_09435 [Aquabacterium sp.]